MGALVDAEPVARRARPGATRARARRRTRAARSRRPSRSGGGASGSRRRAAAAAPRGSPAAAAPRGSRPRRPARPAPPRAASRNGAQRVAAGRVEQLQRVPVARQLGLAGGAALGRRPRRGRPRRRRSATRRRNSRSRSAAPGVLELVGEHRRHRHRQPLGDLEHRQVGADHRVEQPLLAERVGPEALDVGHVGVEDDRQVAGAAGSLRHGRRRGSRAPGRGRLSRSAKSEAAIAGVKRS